MPCLRRGTHCASDCTKFRGVAIENRRKLARKHRLCFCCLQTSRSNHTCSTKQCGQEGCRSTHHRLLRRKKQRQRDANNKPESSKDPQVTVAISRSPSSQAFLKIVPVRVIEPAGELANVEEIDKNSALRPLQIQVIDSVLRLRSRIAATQEVAEKVMRPPILHGDHHITQLYIDWTHRSLQHSGTELTINEVRQHYWVVKMRPTAKKVTARCLHCRICKAQPPVPDDGDRECRSSLTERMQRRADTRTSRHCTARRERCSRRSVANHTKWFL